MTPSEFAAKWSAATVKESAGAKEHFIDLCRMLGYPTPTQADPTGEWYAFEKGAEKTEGGDGFADVWKRGHFAWEYKGRRKNLDLAYAQLQQYAPALENPPLLIVSDMETIILRPNWTNSVSRPIILRIEELRDANRRAVLKRAFTDPDALRPEKTRQALTEEAAAAFAELARRLRARGHGAEEVAHFVNRLVFCLFADDAAWSIAARPAIISSSLCWVKSRAGAAILCLCIKSAMNRIASLAGCSASSDFLPSSE